MGGNGHSVGRQRTPPAGLVADLTAWTTRHFPGAERTHVWSAQDYQAHNHVPFVGKLPRGGGHVFLATGYNRWGMTNAAAAALRISSEVLGGNMPGEDVGQPGQQAGQRGQHGAGQPGGGRCRREGLDRRRTAPTQRVGPDTR